MLYCQINVESLNVFTITNPQLMAYYLNEFLKMIEYEFEQKPMIFTSFSYWNQWPSFDFSKYLLWISDYDANEPRLNKTWSW